MHRLTNKHSRDSAEPRWLADFQPVFIVGCERSGTTLLASLLDRHSELAVTPETHFIDDIAHSPEKARSVLNNLRHIYPGLVIAVFEPNTGNRTRQSKSAYKDAFRDADTVVVPKLSRLKVDASDPERTFEGDELAETIRESHKEVYYIDDDDKLVDYLTTARGKGDIIAFLGSHGFRWMIEETVKRLGGQE